MNVARRERHHGARHEATHAAVMIVLGHIPDEVEILPPRGPDLGYVTGSCTIPSDASRGVIATVWAAGCLDGHGAGADELALLEAVPDEAERLEVLALTEQIMEHPEFVRLRDRIGRRLMFADRLTRAQLLPIIEAATPPIQVREAAF